MNVKDLNIENYQTNGVSQEQLSIDDFKNLLTTIRQEAEHWADLLWSPNQFNEMQQCIDALREKMAALSDGIIKNLYRYEQRDWKRFVPDKEQLRKDEQEQAISKEKNRLLDWQKSSLQCSSFYLSFKGQLEKHKLLNALLSSNPFNLQQAHVLDMSCGDGQLLRTLQQLGAAPHHLVGIELSEPLLMQAAALSSPDIKYTQAFPDRLPFNNATFDLILITGLLMHVLDENLLHRIAQEALRLLATGGMIVTFNYNKDAWKQLEPYLQYTTLGMDVGELTRLFPDCHIDYEDLSPYGLAVITTKSIIVGVDE